MILLLNRDVYSQCQSSSFQVAHATFSADHNLMNKAILPMMTHNTVTEQNNDQAPSGHITDISPTNTNDQSNNHRARKKQKLCEPSQLTTGFLVDGSWVHRQRFACITCRRGHRSKTCECAKDGKAVGPVPTAGRPCKGELKATDCRCSPLVCTCLHQSYIIERSSVGDGDGWIIKRAVITNGKGDIVDDPLRGHV